MVYSLCYQRHYQRRLPHDKDPKTFKEVVKIVLQYCHTSMKDPNKLSLPWPQMSTLLENVSKLVIHDRWIYRMLRKLRQPKHGFFFMQLDRIYFGTHVKAFTYWFFLLHTSLKLHILIRGTILILTRACDPEGEATLLMI